MQLKDGTMSEKKVPLRDGINAAVGGPADLYIQRNPKEVLDLLDNG